MNDLICPACGKRNTDKVEICQYCGTALKRNATEPLDAIHPGDMPVKRKTSDLERTLPGWLRDARQASKTDAEDNIPDADLSFPHASGANTKAPTTPPPAPNNQPAAPIDFLAGLSHVNDDEEETPDWLKGLVEDLPAQDEQKPEPQRPGWLDDLSTPEPPAQAEQNVNLDDASETLGFGDSRNDPGQTGQESPDWLKTLQSEEQESKPASPKSPDSADATSDQLVYGDLPDWLAALTGSPASAPNAKSTDHTPAASGSEDAPDWLASLGGDFSAEDTPLMPQTGSLVSKDSPDWLNRMDDGLSMIPEAPSANKEDATDLSAWLSGLSDVEENGQASPAPTSASMENMPQDDALPDWMAGLQDAAPTEPAQTATAVEPLAAADLPDWMAGLQDAVPTEPAQTAAAVEPLAAADLPDWMAGLQDAAPTEPAQTAASADLPDWLSAAMGAAAPQDKQPSDLSKPFDTGSLGDLHPIGADEPLPDWMASLGAPADVEQTDQPALPPTEEQNAPVSEIVPEQAIPDWLSGLPAPLYASEEPSTLEAETAQNVEASASELNESSNPQATEEQKLDSILSMDMPDWLSGFAEPAQGESNIPAEQGNPQDSSLQPAELPSWVQAMRPMESVMAGTQSSEDDQEAEKQGPLAGLRNVLPTQLDLPEIQKPKQYAIKLLATQTQLTQADLLENLLNSENIPQVVVSKPEKIIIRWVRWLIAAVLVAGMLAVLTLETRIFPTANLSTSQSAAGSFIEITNNLPEAAPVLVVVDYQPGYVGELEPAANVLIEQLMSKNARLAFISTSPIGVFLSDRLVQKFAGKYSYQLGAQYVNLGYLPGGSGGIKVFSEQPASTVGQDSILGNMWKSPALESVTINQQTRLANFAAVFIITDSPDTGRLWIEQAQPSLLQKPLLMLVSAQAEPMIQPYWSSGQLQGLMAGLEGAALYENALAKPGQAVSYWDAFGVGMLAAELFIIIGAVWSLALNLRARRTGAEQDEA